MEVKDITRDSNGKLPAYTWPGGYPIIYYASDYAELCPKCANKYVAGRDSEEQLKPIMADVYWEGPAIQCENCDVEITSAYGDPEFNKLTDMSCNQCEAMMINGVYCHETGCPNSLKVKIDGTWQTSDESEDE